MVGDFHLVESRYRETTAFKLTAIHFAELQKWEDELWKTVQPGPFSDAGSKAQARALHSSCWGNRVD